MITSPHNRWLKDIRRLRTSKGRRRDPRLLLEGPNLVAEALDLGLTLDAVLVSEDFAATDAGGELLARLPRPPLLADKTLLDEVADVDSPRGLVALAAPPRRALPKGAGLYLYADGLQDPGNLGALARVAEGAGASGLGLAPGTVSASHPRALRGSAGSLLRLPHRADLDPAALDEHLGGEATWVQLVARAGEDLYRTAPPAGAVVLAVGGEGQGLSPVVEARAELALTIPMAGRVESLNATVAAAVVLFEWRRRLAE